MTTSSFKSLVLILIIGNFSFFPNVAWSQGRKILISPDLSLGLTTGYDNSNAIKADFGHPGPAVKLECRVGYYYDKNWSFYSGLGFGLYNYRIVYGKNKGGNLDTIRNQSEDIFEVPLGIRYTSNRAKLFQTRYYLGGGFSFSFLNDARSDFHTYDYSYSNSVTQKSDFNSMYVRLYLEAGMDVPLDYHTHLYLGMVVANGITRNMSKTGLLAKANFGMPTASLSIGFGFALGKLFSK